MPSKSTYRTVQVTIVALILITVIAFVITSFLRSGENFKDSMAVKASIYNTDNSKYADNVYIIRGNDVVVTEGKILLKGRTKKLKKGLIIVGEEAPGFMRRIDNVYTGRTETIFTTTKVEIEEVFNHLDIEIEVDSSEMTFENIDERDGSIVYDAPADGKNRKEGFTFNRDSDYDLNLDAFDSGEIDLIADRRPLVGQTDLESGVKFQVKGSVRVKPTIKFKVVINWGVLKSMAVDTSLVCSLSVEPRLQATSGFRKTITKRIWPTSRYLRPRLHVPLMVGVWITVNPTLGLKLDARLLQSLILAPKFSISTKKPSSFVYRLKSPSNTRLTGGRSRVEAKMVNGGWDTSFKAGDIFTPDGLSEASIEAGVDVGLDLLLWGFVGPYIRINPHYRYEVKFADSDITSLGTQGGGFTSKKGPGLIINGGGRLRGYDVSAELYKKFWAS